MSTAYFSEDTFDNDTSFSSSHEPYCSMQDIRKNLKYSNFSTKNLYYEPLHDIYYEEKHLKTFFHLNENIVKRENFSFGESQIKINYFGFYDENNAYHTYFPYEYNCLLMIYDEEKTILIYYTDLLYDLFNCLNYRYVIIKNNKYSFDDITHYLRLNKTGLDKNKCPVSLKSTENKIIYHSKEEDDLKYLYQLFKVKNLIALQNKLIYEKVEDLFKLTKVEVSEEKVYYDTGKYNPEIYNQYIKPFRNLENKSTKFNHNLYFSAKINSHFYEMAKEFDVIDEKGNIKEQDDLLVSLTEQRTKSDLKMKISSNEKYESILATFRAYNMESQFGFVFYCLDQYFEEISNKIKYFNFLIKEHEEHNSTTRKNINNFIRDLYYCYQWIGRTKYSESLANEIKDLESVEFNIINLRKFFNKNNYYRGSDAERVISKEFRENECFAKLLKKLLKYSMLNVHQQIRFVEYYVATPYSVGTSQEKIEEKLKEMKIEWNNVKKIKVNEFNKKKIKELKEFHYNHSVLYCLL